MFYVCSAFWGALRNCNFTCQFGQCVRITPDCFINVLFTICFNRRSLVEFADFSMPTTISLKLIEMILSLKSEGPCCSTGWWTTSWKPTLPRPCISSPQSESHTIRWETPLQKLNARSHQDLKRQNVVVKSIHSSWIARIRRSALLVFLFSSLCVFWSLIQGLNFFSLRERQAQQSSLGSWFVYIC